MPQAPDFASGRMYFMAASEDAIAQRERLKEERIAAHEHPVSEVLEQCESLPDEVEQAAVDDFEEDYEQEEFEESMDFSISM